MRHLLAILAAVGTLWSRSVIAQHEAHHPAPGADQPPAAKQQPSVAELELLRNASGTAWQPENTPHAALHTQVAGVDLMFHGLLFAGYDYQGSERGDHEPVGIGWIMGMARKRFETASLTGRLMLSPEPWTAAQAGGYPLLLQTGETFEGQALHDRQHPHDLFMEIAALYTLGLTPQLGLQLYAAPAGEPALGPVAYPHRYSASADPFATLAHHWQDSTHISFGVLTMGVITRWAKLEGSWFNGREPDETRYDFDFRGLDSYSVRASIAPTPAWSGQISYGFLASPEDLRPDEAVHRVTASTTYLTDSYESGIWASTLVFGLNKEGHGTATGTLIAETKLDLDGRNVVFGRAELLQKTGHDLVLTSDLDESRLFLGSLALGYLRNLLTADGLALGLGARAALGFIPGALEPFYGTRLGVGGIAFLRATVAPVVHETMR